MVVRNIDCNLHNILWLTLGGDKLRLFVKPIIERNLDVLPMSDLMSHLHSVTIAQLERDIIYARR